MCRDFEEFGENSLSIITFNYDRSLEHFLSVALRNTYNKEAAEVESVLREQIPIVAAIGNHEEERGDPVSQISAAVILGDKSDVHRSRVQNPDILTFDIHDRVNYAVQRSFVRVDGDKKTVTLELDVDTEVSKVAEYFEIFMSRMLMSRRAARFLGCKFALTINGNSLF